MTKKIDQSILDRAQVWLDGLYDEDTKARIREMMENNPAELTDSFYRDLEFGTGGLRGIMGTGTNRMNKYTVGMATQGLANYLIRMFPGIDRIKTAVSYDSRNNSKDFAQICAQVFAANGFDVFLFDDIRPTPVLSFAIRQLGCQSGVMITASHNPKEYNGYKAYWDDGAQMIAPHDVNVIGEVQKITSVDHVKWTGNPDRIKMIGTEIDNAYLDRVAALTLSPDVVKKQRDLRIVYTPLHGAGRKLVPGALARYGFTNVIVVKEQATADGNFPTVHSPNPEEHAALEMGIRQANEKGAALVLATDPDADRVGIAVRNDKNEFVLLNGNQTAAILFYYVLNKWKEDRRFTGSEFIIKTIVTSELLTDIAEYFGIIHYDVLTGFKFIADVIRRMEGKLRFIIGGEESYGYLISDFVRDKDAVSSCAMIAEAAAWMADRGKTLYDLLLDLYIKFSVYKEQLFSVTKKGKSGAEEIQEMMVGYRTHPMKTINDSKVLRIRDFKTLKEKDLVTGAEKDILLPASNVLQFILEDGSVISVRPSGTEPKIKFYFSARMKLDDRSKFGEADQLLEKRIRNIISSMNLE